MGRRRRIIIIISSCFRQFIILHLAAAGLLLCSGSGSVIVTSPSSTTVPITNNNNNNNTKSDGRDSAVGSWCVATQPVSQTALQAALDYACGHAGTDCSAIQPGGTCFEPVTLRAHASYAFNSYYQANPVPTSCTFHDSAVITSTDPSYGACQYPSTSTSSSLLNTSNSNGARVFGAGTGPNTPSTSSAAGNGMPALSSPKRILLTSSS